MFRSHGWVALALMGSVVAAAPMPKVEPAGKKPRAATKPHESKKTPTAQPPDDESTLRSFYSANGLAQREMFDLAAAEYRAFLHDHPNHASAADARYGLGLCLYRQGKSAEAVEALGPIADDPPTGRESDVPLLLGQCLLADEKFDRAVEALERARVQSKNGSRWEAAGAGTVEAYCRMGKHADAARVRDEFVSRTPESSWRDRVEWFAALSAVQTGKDELARERLSAMVRSHPNSPLRDPARLVLGQCRLRTGDVGAGDEFRDLADGTKNPDIQRDALLGLSTAELMAGNSAAADAALARAKSLLPNVSPGPALRLQTGRVRFAQEKFDEALVEFEALAASDDPTAADAAYWVAKCHLRMGHDGKAAELFAKAAASTQTQAAPEALFDRAVALSRAGRHVETIAAVNSFLAKHQDHALAGDSLAMRAVAEFQLERKETAAESAGEFLRRFPDHPRAGDMLFLAADCAFLEEKYEAAAAAFGRYVSIYPDGQRSMTASLRMATCAVRQNKWEEARLVLEKLVESQPTAPEYAPSALMLADVYLHSNDWSKAEQVLTEFVTAQPEHARLDEALLKCGVARQRMGEYESAINRYNELAQQLPASVLIDHALFERGQCHAALSDWGSARASFEEILKHPASSFHLPAKQQLAELAVRTGDFALAASEFRAIRGTSEGSTGQEELTFREGESLLAAGDYPSAERVLSKYLEQATAAQRWTARAKLAIALARQKKHAEALASAENLTPSAWTDLESSLRSVLRFELAWCFRELKQPDKAAELYALVVSETGSADLVFRARLELATLEMEAQRWTEAYALLQKLGESSSIYPKDSNTDATPTLADEVLYRRGTCAYRLARYAEVTALLEPWLQRNANAQTAPGARFMLGDALLREGRASDALTHLKLVKPGDDRALAAAATLRLGECHAALQQWSESEAVFGEFLSEFSGRDDWFLARFGMGWAQEHLGKLNDAITTYSEVVTRHRGPTAARAQFQIGECHFAKKDHEIAARELLKVDILYAYPEWSAAALYEAGRCLELLGKTSDARKQFEMVKEKYPDTQWAKLAAEQLTRRDQDSKDAKG